MIWNKIKIGIAFVVGWVSAQWFEFQAKVEEQRRQTEAVLKSQKEQFKREAAHNERMAKISNLPDDDISRSLSSYPAENTHTNSARNRARAGEKL